MKIKDDDSKQHIIHEIIEKRNIKDDKNNNRLFKLKDIILNIIDRHDFEHN